jgi:hypothetical protein
MATETLNKPMTGEEMIALSKKHTLFEWTAQSKADPIPVARAKGIYFWTPEGKRFIDFNSQLMCVNIGHGDERVIRAIQEQVAVLAYANPFMATEPRARLGAKLAEIAPGDIDVFFFTNGGAEANENAIKLARLATGRHRSSRVIVRIGAAAGSMTLTGDPRRWAAEPECGCRAPSSIRIAASPARLGHGRQSLAWSMRSIQLEGRTPSRPSSGIGHPRTASWCRQTAHAGRPRAVHEARHPDRRSDGGFGRTGEWLRSITGRWCCIITMAKGLTSAYARPWGCGALSRISSGQGLLRRPHLQQPSARLRRGTRDHQGLDDSCSSTKMGPDEGSACRSRKTASSVGALGRSAYSASWNSSATKAKKRSRAVQRHVGGMARSEFFRQGNRSCGEPFFTNPPLASPKQVCAGLRDHRPGSRNPDRAVS